MKTINSVEISEETIHYLDAALWSSTISLPVIEEKLNKNLCMDVHEDHPLYEISENDPVDKHFSITDCSPNMLKEAEKDVSEWFTLLKQSDLYDLAIEITDDAHVAHDLWLTRNGHGAGYWDGDYGNDGLGDELTKLCEGLLELHVWVNEDGILNFE